MMTSESTATMQNEEPLSIDALADTLALSFDSLTPEEQGALGLIWAALHVANGVNDRNYTRPLVTAYVHLVLPKVSPSRVRRLIDRAKEFGGADELQRIYSGDEVRKAFPPQLLLCSLIHLLPPSGTNARPAWGTIDQISDFFEIPQRFADSVNGWKTRSAGDEVTQGIEELKKRWANLNKVSKAVADMLAPVEEHYSERDFLEVRQQVRDQLDQIEPLLQELHVTKTLREELKDYLQNDRFRLAVMGEFKRGKSTLINALLESADVMPAARLPCTSALTEIRYGAEQTFEVSHNRGYPGTFKPQDRETFEGGVAQAAETRYSRDEAEEVATSIPHWRVCLPSPFLEQSAISLIDSPGLGEDYARDQLTKLEVKRADAAILVFIPDQLASLDELELIEEMDTKASDLFVVVNKSDYVPEEEWPELKQHALKKIGEVTDVFSEDRLVFLSAKEAEDAVRSGRKDDPWLERLNSFRDQVSQRLLERIGIIKMGVLRRKTVHLVENSVTEMTHQIESRRKLLEKIEGLENARTASEQQYENAVLSVELATNTLSESKATKEQLKESFQQLLPELTKHLQDKKGEWSSKRSAMLSPKKFAKEIAEQAQKDLTQFIQAWASEDGAMIVGEGVEKQYDEAAKKIEQLLAYLEDSTGIDPESFREQLRSKTFETAFGAQDFTTAGDVVGRSVLTAAISVVVGYIVADIVLYYILGVISGFLNPILLAAAVVAAIPAAIFGGRFIEGSIKNKIIELLDEKLRKGKAREAIDRGIDQAVDDVFRQISTGFKRSAEDLLQEARFQRERTQKELEEFIDKVGNSPNAKRKELRRLEALAEQAEQKLEELNSCVQ
jgi:ribosome biogenesis GTPase A